MINTHNLPTFKENMKDNKLYSVRRYFRRHQIYRLSICITLLFLYCFSTEGTNIVTRTISGDISASSEKLEMCCKTLSNENERVRISFELKSDNTPFTIYRAEWVNCDSVYKPLEPFSLIAQADESFGKSAEWNITLEFPFSDSFDENDILILYTDRGIVRCPVSREGQLKETIDILRNDYEKQIDISKESSHKAWLILGVVLSCMLISGGTIFIIVRRKFIIRRREIEELSLLIAERTDRNHELEAKANSLYSSRLDTLNMLCNEYFEKSGSENIKLSLYNEVEKHILALRDPKSIVELEKIVNAFLNDILVKVKEELPELNKNDLTFLTYLYAGFSPRAVCIFTNIKIKNFYNRRSRLKDRILASGAPDREYFVSKM